MDFLVRKLRNPKFMAVVVVDDYLNNDAKTTELLKKLSDGSEITTEE